MAEDSKTAIIPRMGQRRPKGESQEKGKYENEVGETTGASTGNLLALAINQTSTNMNIRLHLIALAVLFPSVLVFSAGNPAWNLLGILYCVVLWKASTTNRGERFVRRYYHEILRLENFFRA